MIFFNFWFVIHNNFQTKIVDFKRWFFLNIFIFSKYKSDLSKRQVRSEVEGKERKICVVKLWR